MKLPSDFFSINGDPFTEEEISELKESVRFFVCGGLVYK